MRCWTLLAMVLVLAACPPAPVPPPQPPDASDATAPVLDAAPSPADVVEAAPVPPGDASLPSTPCQSACANLAAVRCPEGAAADCVRTFAHIESERVRRTPDTGPGKGFPLTCLMLAGGAGTGYAGVHSVADARALGVKCQ